MYTNNTETVKIFVSYKWGLEQNLITNIVNLLNQLDNIEPLIDKNFVRYEDPSLRGKIFEQLDACDCVLVSSTAINGSQEVVSELIRADAKGKVIVIICDRKEENRNFPPYLFFLAEKLRLTYKDFQELNQELQSFFRNKRKRDFEKIPNELHLLYKITKERFSGNEFSFRDSGVKRILGEAYQEIDEIYQNRYAHNIGTETSFLIRAKSIFENASKVYAISHEKMHNYWGEKNNQSLAIDYIKSQPEKTIRLFVFSSATEANYYVNILEANHRRYGKIGAVLICSKESYKAFINQFPGKNSIKEYLDQDFATLFLKEFSNSDIMEAMLVGAELRYDIINIDNSSRIDYRALIDRLESLSSPDVEQFSNDVDPNQLVVIKRWNPEWRTDHSLWISELKQLFPQPTFGDAYHFISFTSPSSNDNLELGRYVLRLYTEIQRINIEKKLGIESLWIGKKEMSLTSDREFGVNSTIRQEYDYLIVMKFASQEELQRYYWNVPNLASELARSEIPPSFARYDFLKIENIGAENIDFDSIDPKLRIDFPFDRINVNDSNVLS